MLIGRIESSPLKTKSQIYRTNLKHSRKERERGRDFRSQKRKKNPAPLIVHQSFVTVNIWSLPSHSVISTTCHIQLPPLTIDKPLFFLFLLYFGLGIRKIIKFVNVLGFFVIVKALSVCDSTCRHHEPFFHLSPPPNHRCIILLYQ